MQFLQLRHMKPFPRSVGMKRKRAKREIKMKTRV